MMASGAGFVVLREAGKDRFVLVGEAARRPGLTAKAARLRAIQDATGGKTKPGERYRVILRSEWKVAAEEPGA
jgi:hypothetical protein